MTFDFSANGLIISRYDGSDFQEDNLTIVGSGDVSVVKSGGDFTISVATSSGTIDATYLRLDGTNGPMTGSFDLSGDPSTDLQPATKQYVDAAAAAAAITVKQDGSEVVADARSVDFGVGFTVSSGASDEADVIVDETDFTSVVFLAGAQDITGAKTFTANVVMEGDLQVDGNLTVTGTTTTLNTEELLVEDNIVVLNSTVTGAPSLDAGIEIERGTSANVQVLWDESEDYFVASTSASGVLERILLESDLTAIDADLATLSGLIDTNITDIATNAADIVTLSGLIDTNATDITTLSGWVDSNFVELNGDTMTGALILNDDPSADLGAATKQYVDAQVAGANIVVEVDNSVVSSGAGILNFTTGLDVVDAGGGQVDISVDLTELNAVDLTSAQTISGVKTFADGIILGSLAEPASGTADGTQGDVRWADDYLYIATATNTWKRVAIASF